MKTLRAHHVFDSAYPGFSVELLPTGGLREEEIAHWKGLARRAGSPNPFAEPEFIIPLVKYLESAAVSLLIVREPDSRWHFAVPIVAEPTTIKDPLRHFRALKSIYTFLDQALVGQDDPEMVLTCLFETLRNQRHWHGLRFARTVRTGAEQELMDRIAGESGAHSDLATVDRRPCVTPQTSTSLLENCSKSRRKSLRRGWKKLEQIGSVAYRLVNDPVRIPDAVAEFLRLEEAGWKGETGTAMNCRSEDRAFFIEMCTRFSESGRIHFGEVLLDGQIVASTCNLQSGRRLFAFKIGWNPNLSECNLGYWSEILLADAVCRERPSIELIDSCSGEDSYTGRVWQERIEISTASYLWSRRARIMQTVKHVARTVPVFGHL